MFVKVYQYHVHQDKLDEYIRIQEKAANIYAKYLDFQTLYFNSTEDKTKWIEVSRYKSKEEYERSIHLVNEEEDIHKLFHEFQSLLIEDNEIIEEDFVQKFEKSTF
ncbi:hypothetical protein SAMN05421676_105197 [Salinibacillus kushneri]|uniref:Antibiotic biosynthesis monooxygenase n=1 Tax=Salinibacillus kushneri TaxID=237682 RepID=A0A1I0F496_9BACI|nr:hypothetical protein SAMN05421676_105197 [Salinibacillus kushneri]